MNAQLRAGFACMILAGLPFGAQAEPSGPLVDAVPSITVEGEAKREVVPDLAVITLGVVTDRPTATQASTDNATAASAVVAAARLGGVGDTDIRTATLSLSAITDQRDASKVRAFRARNQVTLQVHDLAKLGPLVGQLAAQGANDIDGIAFMVQDPRPILDVLRAGATQEAARKAEIYAKAAGVKLGRILRIVPDAGSNPGPMPRAYKLQMADAAPPPPVEAGTETLESRVTVTWELLP